MVELTPPRHIPTLPRAAIRLVETIDRRSTPANGSTRPFAVICTGILHRLEFPDNVPKSVTSATRTPPVF